MHHFYLEAWTKQDPTFSISYSDKCHLCQPWIFPLQLYLCHKFLLLHISPFCWGYLGNNVSKVVAETSEKAAKATFAKYSFRVTGEDVWHSGLTVFVHQTVTKEIIATSKLIGMCLSLCLIFAFWQPKIGDRDGNLVLKKSETIFLCPNCLYYQFPIAIELIYLNQEWAAAFMTVGAFFQCAATAG